MASYLSVEWANAGNDYAGANTAGAIGGCISSGGSVTKVSNVFSSVITNKKTQGEAKAVMKEDCYIVSSNIGNASKNSNSNATFEFANAFGCVKPSVNGADFTEVYYTLYKTDWEQAYPETNCKGCEELPEGHGFDTSIWDLSDPKKPRLK